MLDTKLCSSYRSQKYFSCWTYECTEAIDHVMLSTRLCCSHWSWRLKMFLSWIRVYVLQPQIKLCWVQYCIAAVDHDDFTMLTTIYSGPAIDHCETFIMNFDQYAQRSWDQDAERVWCEGTAPSTTLQEGRGDEMELRGSCGIMCIYCYLNKLFVDLLQLAWILFRELSRSRTVNRSTCDLNIMETLYDEETHWPHKTWRWTAEEQRIGQWRQLLFEARLWSYTKFQSGKFLEKKPAWKIFARQMRIKNFSQVNSSKKCQPGKFLHVRWEN